ncbi:dynamin family protein [Formosa sp. PL04]|uniref:dynamin family protein n=1 Tax=Formosa sp. PL04 TaxID=3081755 RepID=UPI0029823CBD|nr:dynamin family protein [Formosa sp. PL04]MDW5288580.1 dynamin family protein [Formosa sp. PL04]
MSLKNPDEIFLNQINKIEKYPFLADPSFLYYKTQLQNIKENLLNKEFRITVVGEFSSGKSTFLNCLIGKDILPKGVNETTATITYVHNVVNTHEYCDKAVVHYNDSSKEKTIISFKENKNALNEFVSTISRELDVVKEVQSVHLYTTFKGITENVVLIDTPGSNGTAKGHREIAIREIQNAHASLCLFHLRGFGESDLAYVKEISNYQKSIFYVMNFFDEIKKHEGESEKSKLTEFKKQINELVYNGKPNNAKVYGVSALLGLVSKDHSITSLYNNINQTEISLEKRSELYSKSLMGPLEIDLYSYINSGERLKTFYNSIAQKLYTLISDLYNLFEGKKEISEAKINKAELGLISKKLDHINEKTIRNKEKVKTHLHAQQGDLEKSTVAIIKLGLEKIRSQIKLEVDKETLETLEKKVNHKYNNMIRSEIQIFQNKLTVILQDKLTVINTIIQDHIHEYIPMIEVGEKGNLKFVSSSEIVLTDVKLESDKNILNKVLIELNNEFESKSSVYEKEQNELQNKKIQADIEISKKNKEIIKIKEATARAKKELGAKPYPQKKVVKVEKDRTSILGLFFQPVIGKKTVEENKYSNTNVNKWTKKFNQIIIDASNNEKILIESIDKINNGMRNIETGLNTKSNEITALQRRKETYQKKLDRVKTDVEFYKTNAKNEFIRNQKKEINENIIKVLMPPSGNIYCELREISRINIAKNIKLLEDVNMKYYDQKVKEYEAKLQTILLNIQGKGSINEVQGLEKNINILKKEKVNFEKNILAFLN